MDAAIFRSNGKNFVNFNNIHLSFKTCFFAKSGVWQILHILDFRQVTRSDIRMEPDMEMEGWLGFENVGGST